MGSGWVGSLARAVIRLCVALGSRPLKVPCGVESLGHRGSICTRQLGDDHHVCLKPRRHEERHGMLHHQLLALDQSCPDDDRTLIVLPSNQPARQRPPQSALHRRLAHVIERHGNPRHVVDIHSSRLLLDDPTRASAGRHGITCLGDIVPCGSVVNGILSGVRH